MLEIKRYSDKDKDIWNAFVATSRQGTFLFNRNYMDYHRDRFHDHSLMVYRKGSLYALLPANEDGDTLWSHQGLTYGGMLTNEHATAVDVQSVFSLINSTLRKEGFHRVVYKPIPWHYHRQPSEEDLYALTQTCGAKLIVRNLGSVINLCHPVKMRYGRRYDINKAVKNGIIIREDAKALPEFWDVLVTNLRHVYNSSPVHSLSEMDSLMSAFPDNIKLFVASNNGTVVGGTIIYICNHVVHTQYISASEEGKRLHALDLLFKVLLQQYGNYQYFDFGTSNEDFGKRLNEGLIFQKEGFGGRGICYDWYGYNL